MRIGGESTPEGAETPGSCGSLVLAMLPTRQALAVIQQPGSRQSDKRRQRQARIPRKLHKLCTLLMRQANVEA
jgi:hypothetical protein